MSIAIFPRVILGALPKTSTSKFSNFFVTLFKNRGVQAGTGLAAVGGGLGVLGLGARSATGNSPFSGILVMVVIVIILLVVIKR